MIGGRGDRGTRRFGTTYLDPISADDLHLALSVFTTDGWDILTPTGEHALVYMTPEAAGAIVALCHGEPFLFQLADARAWLAGTSRIIDLNDVRAGWELAKPEAEDHLQRILDRLPLRERQFVEAMALLPAADRTLTRIAEEMGLDKASSAGPTSQRLDRARHSATWESSIHVPPSRTRGVPHQQLARRRPRQPGPGVASDGHGGAAVLALGASAIGAPGKGSAAAVR